MPMLNDKIYTSTTLSTISNNKIKGEGNNKKGAAKWLLLFLERKKYQLPLTA
jgi:hypothetical protein